MDLRRALIGWAFGVGAVCLADRPACASDLDTCNTALVRGQELAKGGKLLEARAEYPSCLRPVCDASLRAVCANFLADLTGAVPSIKLETQGDANARFFVDGSPIADAASPIEINPGTHRIRAEATGHLPSETQVTLEKGEHRSVALTLVPIAKPRHDEGKAGSKRPRGIPTTALALGGVALLAVGSFAYFGLTGKSTESELRISCKAESCDSGAMRRAYLAADISAIVALIAAGSGAWIALGSEWGR